MLSHAEEVLLIDRFGNLKTADGADFRLAGATLSGSELAQANARRLVACWNDHDGLVHDNARLYKSLQCEMQGRLKAEQERDEALAAFRDLYTEVMVEFGYCPDPVKFEAILAKHQKVTG